MPNAPSKTPSACTPRQSTSCPPWSGSTKPRALSAVAIAPPDIRQRSPICARRLRVTALRSCCPEPGSSQTPQPGRLGPPANTLKASMRWASITHQPLPDILANGAAFGRIPAQGWASGTSPTAMSDRQRRYRAECRHRPCSYAVSTSISATVTGYTGTYSSGAGRCCSGCGHGCVTSPAGSCAATVSCAAVPAVARSLEAVPGGVVEQVGEDLVQVLPAVGTRPRGRARHATVAAASRRAGRCREERLPGVPLRQRS
jgi:hypothetical protein